jgi:hypothetical protein
MLPALFFCLRRNVPRFVCHNMPPDSRSNEKARFCENSWHGVTILQWCKRFDATLGLCVLSALNDYSEGLHLDGQLPKVQARRDKIVNSLGWMNPLAQHLQGFRLALVPAWGLT